MHDPALHSFGPRIRAQNLQKSRSKICINTTILAIQMRNIRFGVDNGHKIDIILIMNTKPDRIMVRLEEKTKETLKRVAIKSRWSLSTAARHMIEDGLAAFSESRPASEIDRIADLSPFSAPKP